MTEAIRDSYNHWARQYTDLFIGEIDNDQFGQNRLKRLAEQIDPTVGPVLDLGCGPGAITNYLAGLSVKAIGYDLSDALIAEAKQAFPDSEYHVGDLTALDTADGSIAGIVSRYSLIHLDPAQLGDVFAEWARALALGAPVLLSFFSALTADTHGLAFDHTVVTAYALFPDAVVETMKAAGFEHFEVAIFPPPEGGRPFEGAVILARRGPVPGDQH